MRLKGRVLWWDARDGYGIALHDSLGEFYIDSSAINKDDLSKIKPWARVEFERNERIKHVKCGCNLTVIKIGESDG